MSQEPWAVEIRNKYGTSEQFLVTFNPGKQGEYFQLLERCFTGTAPTLVRLSKTYGIDISKSWIMVQIMDLADFCGIKEKPCINSMLSFADVIINNYGYLKVTELMVFFQKFKAGEYGKFYGVFDNLVITSALNEFLSFRKQIIDKEQKRLEDEKRNQIWEESKKNGISHEEYINKCRRNDQKHH